MKCCNFRSFVKTFCFIRAVVVKAWVLKGISDFHALAILIIIEVKNVSEFPVKLKF